jgi:hypothetical protein
MSGAKIDIFPNIPNNIGKKYLFNMNNAILLLTFG